MMITDNDIIYAIIKPDCLISYVMVITYVIFHNVLIW